MVAEAEALQQLPIEGLKERRITATGGSGQAQPDTLAARHSPAQFPYLSFHGRRQKTFLDPVHAIRKKGRRYLTCCSQSCDSHVIFARQHACTWCLSGVTNLLAVLKDHCQF